MASVSRSRLTELAALMRLDPTQVASDKKSPRLKRSLPRGLILSVLFHSLPVLTLISWRSTPAEIPKSIPIELAIEQPPPSQPEPPASQLKSRGASTDLADVAAPKVEQGTGDKPPIPAEPQPPAASPTASAEPPRPQPEPAPVEPQPPLETQTAATTPPRPPAEPAPAEEAALEALPPPIKSKAVAMAPPVPPKQMPHKEPATIRMASAWPLPLRQDHPREAQRSASLTGPAAIFDEYCAHALNLTMRHIDLLPRSYLGDRRGKTVLTIRILGDGTVNSVRVAQSSGYPDIDQRIERMVFAVGQYPPLPPRMPGSWMDFTFMMVFPDAAER